MSISFECKWKQCGMNFESGKGLYVHVYNDHIHQLTCYWEKCQYIGKRRSQIVSHVMVHISYFPHHCTICGKSFKRKYDLGKHAIFHEKLVEKQVFASSKEIEVTKWRPYHSISPKSENCFCDKIELKFEKDPFTNRSSSNNASKGKLDFILN